MQLATPKIWFCQNCGVVILSAIRKKAFSDCLSSPDTKQSKPTFLGRSEVSPCVKGGVATHLRASTRDASSTCNSWGQVSYVFDTSVLFCLLGVIGQHASLSSLQQGFESPRGRRGEVPRSFDCQEKTKCSMSTCSWATKSLDKSLEKFYNYRVRS